MEVIRGGIYWVDFQTKEDSMQSGIRPAIVTSNDMCNRYSSIIHVIPLTSNLDKNPIPVHVEVGEDCGLPKKSIALVEQETVIPKKRVGDQIGECTPKVLKQIENAIKIQNGIKTEPFSIPEMLKLAQALYVARLNYDDRSIVVRVLKQQFINYCELHDKNYKLIYNKYCQREKELSRSVACV